MKEKTASEIMFISDKRASFATRQEILDIDIEEGTIEFAGGIWATITDYPPLMPAIPTPHTRALSARDGGSNLPKYGIANSIYTFRDLGKIINNQN